MKVTVTLRDPPPSPFIQFPTLSLYPPRNEAARKLVMTKRRKIPRIFISPSISVIGEKEGGGKSL